jgi:hypothetical protein
MSTEMSCLCSKIQQKTLSINTTVMPKRLFKLHWHTFQVITKLLWPLDL